MKAKEQERHSRWKSCMCKVPVAGRALGRNSRAEGGEGDREEGTEPDHTGLLATGRSLHLILLQGEATEGAWRGRVMANSHPEHSLGPGFSTGLGHTVVLNECC